MLVSLDEILAAVPRVAALASRTRVVEAGPTDGRPAFLKCQNRQPSGAFKILLSGGNIAPALLAAILHDDNGTGFPT